MFWSKRFDDLSDKTPTISRSYGVCISGPQVLVQRSLGERRSLLENSLGCVRIPGPAGAHGLIQSTAKTLAGTSPDSRACPTRLSDSPVLLPAISWVFFFVQPNFDGLVLWYRACLSLQNCQAERPGRQSPTRQVGPKRVILTLRAYR